jgi:hypothetical protein
MNGSIGCAANRQGCQRARGPSCFKQRQAMGRLKAPSAASSSETATPRK